MTTQTFTVSGLHCGGCVQSVQSILRAQTGVAEATVDLATGRADVVTTQGFDPKAAIQAVTKAGFAMTAA